jgi:hypothetical protein
MVTEVHYRYIAPGEQTPDRHPITLAHFDEGEEAPRHGTGETIRLPDEREPDSPEREFEVVRVSQPMSVGFVPGTPYEIIFVLVTDSQSER